MATVQINKKRKVRTEHPVVGISSFYFAWKEIQTANLSSYDVFLRMWSTLRAP